MSKICNKCKTDNPILANYCRHCGNCFNDKPEILYLNVIPKCPAGETIRFEWESKNAEKVTLDGIDVTDKHYFDLPITKSTNVELAVYHGKERLTKSVFIESVKPKVIYKEKTIEIKKESYLIKDKNTIIMCILLCVLFASVKPILGDWGYTIQSFLGIGMTDWKWYKEIIEISSIGLFIITLLTFIYKLCSSKK